MSVIIKLPAVRVFVHVARDQSDLPYHSICEHKLMVGAMLTEACSSCALVVYGV